LDPDRPREEGGNIARTSAARNNAIDKKKPGAKKSGTIGGGKKPAAKKPTSKKAAKKPPGKPPKKPPKGPPRGGGGGEDEHARRLRETHAKVERGLAEADLSDPQRQDYRESVHAILQRMTPAALARLHANAKEYTFFATHEALTAAVRAKYPALRLRSGRILKGMFDRDGVVHMNSGGTLFGRPNVGLQEFHGHELAHAVDGTGHELSNSPEWVRAWEADIRDGGFLGPDSQRSSQEGFSEFGAMLLGGGISYKDARQVMPLAAKFWRERGLV
jgi:hypothetical protein